MTRGTTPAVTYAVSGAGGDLEVRVEVLDEAAGRYRVTVAGTEYHVGWSPAFGSALWWLERDGRAQLVAVEPEGDAVGVTLAVDHVDLRVAPASPLPAKRFAAVEAVALEVRAPMPGLLVAVEVRPGQVVAAGAVVAVIEAMKMQMELRAPAGGTVRDIRAGGREVSAGEVIAVLIPDREGTPPARGGEAGP